MTRHNLNRLSYFVATLEEGSITAAAARLGISKAVVSKQLQLLEDEVGTPLLLRNTRNLRATDAGRAFYDEGKAAIDGAERAFDTVMARDRVPRGRLRVTAPVDYGLMHVAPLVARFSERWPLVDVDLHLTDDRLDLVTDRFDVGFRVGWLEDSSQLARKLQDFEEVAVCAPATLSAHPVAGPADLVGLKFLANRAIAGKRTWTFSNGTQTQEVQLRSASVMNITMAIRVAILESRAFSILPDFIVAEDLAQGRLMRMLPDWTLRKGGVYTVTPTGHVRSHALSHFLAATH
ncbi:LysR family transcriptional regulator [Tritonibacter scottomollicae]|uniref:LysR family transcriptional regulator n=1 Tax=Tritonibacter scottomollicae TaxID=483013 RepID=UPI003AA81D05